MMSCAIGKNLPQSPGVYWFINKERQVIYVGKAKNLKNRLSSYALISKTDSKTQAMLNEAQQVKFKVLDSEIESLLIEAELINTYQPHYNILLKDDKSPLYINITKEEFPRVLLDRKKQFTSFGPFTSSTQAKSILHFARRIFPFCNATPKQKANNKTCFYYHLKLCPGACCGQISPSDYSQIIDNLKLFLSGKKKRLIQQLNRQIKAYAQGQLYEQAAQVRDQLQSLQALLAPRSAPEINLPTLTQDKHAEQLKHLNRILRRLFSLPGEFPLSRIEGYDISNLQGQKATGSLVVLTNGQIDKSQYRRFKIRSLQTPNDPAMIKEVLTRRVKHSQWPTPNLIVVDGGITQLKAAQSVIPWNIPLVGLAKHPDHLVTINKKLKLDPKNPGTKLLQTLRDESHRFAKSYHSHLRSRSISSE